MSTLAARAEAELNGIIARYAAGEAEVVRTYFDRPRTAAEHADLVRRQMGREVFLLDWLDDAARSVPALERGVERHAFVALLEQIADETRHYAALADLAEWLLGHPLTHEEAFEYKVHAMFAPSQPAERQHNPRLPEANAMLDLLRRYHDEYGTYAEDVRRMTEGGGGGSFLQASQLSGDPFRERFAAAMGRIASDELDHGVRHVHSFVAQHVKTEDDLARATGVMREYMAQHLRVRNEIYGNPIGPERLAAIDRGEIEAWAIPAAAPA
jgi:hypothetical protein